ncbi:hypothetical protein BJV77DRAFT_971655 [Russula vinacea]|nr:hypothetical protein BJV77DRAFT_971655 [Russula vinacea]
MVIQSTHTDNTFNLNTLWVSFLSCWFLLYVGVSPLRSCVFLCSFPIYLVLVFRLRLL